MATQTGSFDFKAAKEASKTASGYITDITNGICVHEDDDNWDEATGDAVKITDSEVDIVQAGNLLATMSQNGFEAKTYDSSDNEVVIAHLGYGLGTGRDSVTSYAPYYDLGVRKSGTTKGNYSIAEGYNTTASGYASHAEGSDTYASGSYGSHAEGDLTRAEGPSSHAEGEGTEAGGSESHAEGLNTHAYGMASHAGGCHTEASGDYSFANGYHIIAAQDYQTVIGEYNIEDTATSDNSKMLFIIGNGSVAHPSNALTVDRKGNVTAAGGTNKVLIATGAGSTYTTAGTYLIDGSGHVSASFRADGATIGENENNKSRIEIENDGLRLLKKINGTNYTLVDFGYGSVIGSSETLKDGQYITIGSRNTYYNKGEYSATIGNNNCASAMSAIAFGNDCSATKKAAIALGQNASADGLYSFASNRSTASGTYSHAEGYDTIASGKASHTQGWCTVANEDYQTAIGIYNENKSDNLFEIGNGSSSDNRSNALTVDREGNVTAAGSITAGGLPSGLLAEDVVLADNKTISGNNYGNDSASVAKSGYTPIGIVGMHLQNATSSGTLNTYCMLHSFYLSGTTAYWIVRNTNSGAAKIKVTATILYAKS